MSELKGILPLLKPPGMTSHDCVNKLRRILHMKRVGHTGTLDPSVTGVLPLCVGQATRLADFLHDLPKEYEGNLSIGRSTTTEDADGEIVEERAVSPSLTEEQVSQAIQSFIGTIQQIPPMYSAVKVGGVRLHELARQGKEIERKPREVQIYEIDVLNMTLNSPFPEITLRVKCSKGTYVRTLCVDLGKKLGYPAHMTSLVRTSSGPFRIEECVTFEQIENAVLDGTISTMLKPMDWAVLHYKQKIITEPETQDALNGKRIRLDKTFADGELIRVYSPEQTFLGLFRAYEFNGAMWGKPEKVFHTEGSKS